MSHIWTYRLSGIRWLALPLGGLEEEPDACDVGGLLVMHGVGEPQPCGIDPYEQPLGAVTGLGR